MKPIILIASLLISASASAQVDTITVYDYYIQGEANDTIYEYYDDGALKEVVYYDSYGWVQVIESHRPESIPDVQCSACDTIQQSNGEIQIINEAEQLIYQGTLNDGRFLKGKYYSYDSDGILLRIDLWDNGGLLYIPIR